MKTVKQILAAMLFLMVLTGAALAADMSQVRGYDKDSEQEYQYLLMGTYPYEEDGTEAPLLWRILGREEDTIHLFTEYLIDVRQVFEVDNYKAAKAHKYPKGVTFEETDLYAWVNGEMTQTILKDEDFSAAIVEAGGGKFHIMDNTEMRRTDWGFPDNTMGNTIENPGEVIAVNAKNRKGWGTPYAKAVRLYPDWGGKPRDRLFLFREYGSSSPYWSAKMRTSMCGIIGGNGHLSWSGCGDVQKGVRPALVLDLTKLEITGGTGTLEDPWTMKVKDGAEAGSGETPEGEAGDEAESGEDAESEGREA